ncbi:glycosyltransferase family 4 protein [Fimbriiglobus ruber]|uniref:Glycosyltransferase n=1 Tax=Fimbriiglobus ruber TaxID=1908690 RepID=A0A225DQ90_9BACT|nr:glycosyltransferase family 4 protein [Fimbriiglobus ruber]OWK43552.1 Glycosyltransferase [Fimbriiglobus ruber]
MTAAVQHPTTRTGPALPTGGSDPTSEGPLRWLFVKDRFAWPRASGHDVHTFYMMRGLADLGHKIAVATADPAPDEALAGLPLVGRYCFAQNHPPVPPADTFPLRLSKSQEKFRSYWGVSADRVRQVAAAAADCSADVVVVSGLNVLPYLGAVEGRATVWYAADEWVWHHLSLVKLFRRGTWAEIKPAVIKGLYERAYRPLLDRVWVVSGTDATAFRWFAGIKSLDVVPNGVDADYFRPEPGSQIPNSCAFWGRLDFGPNIQALEWFCRAVWPAVRASVPDARFRIFGFQPTPPVTALAGRDGIDLTADLPDIRPAVRECQAVVLPFVSGGGIKNKLLEAAALGMPVVCTQRACTGLNGPVPFTPVGRPDDWVRALTNLWNSEPARRDAGTAARAWVTAHHTWEAAARTAAAGVRDAVGRRAAEAAGRVGR